MMTFWKVAASNTLCCTLLFTAAAPLEGAITKLREVEFRGEIHEPENLSGVATVGKYLLVGSDEGNHIQVLERVSDGVYEAKTKPIQLADNETETDIEGIAATGDTFYVVGSHSTKRKKVKNDKTRKKNRKRMKKVEHEESRDKVFALKIDPTNGAIKPESSMSLRDNLQQDDILGLFTGIPSKENGVDIEGIAVDGDRLFVGFRGPILRGNYVPVMVRELRSPSYELRFVNLDGLGIRDIAKVGGGFLILAGPMGDGPGSYGIYFWNGKDDVPGEDNPKRAVVKLGDLPSVEKGKAEGLTLMEEDTNSYTLLVLYDSLPKGKPTLFRADKAKELAVR